MINLGAMRAHHAKFVTQFTQTVDACVRDAAQYELQNARERLTTHNRSGKLSAATAVRVFRTSGGRVVRLSNNAKSKYGGEYALFLDRGTRPHVIEARFARFLRFAYNPSKTTQGSPLYRGATPEGEYVFRKRVFHPGSRAFPVFTNARRSGYLWAGALLRSRLAALANTF